MVICHICQLNCKNILGLSSHINQTHKISVEEYYIQYIDNNPNIRICQVCGNSLKFKTLSKGYPKSCSIKCSNKIKDDKWKEKKKQTCLKKYGVECSLQNNIIKEKSRQTCLQKYGVEYIGQSLKIRNKTKLSCLNDYGVEYHSQRSEIKQKRKNTLKTKYGNECLFSNKSIMKSISINKRLDFFNKLISSNRLKDYCIPNFKAEEYTGTKSKSYSWICKKCNNIFNDMIIKGRIPRCPNCNPYFMSSSDQENELYKFCLKYISKDNIIRNDRKVLDNKYELDLYIPSLNLAIEFNGLYWHSTTNGKDKYYHLNKYMACKGKNIQLIQIFEDEWYEKRSIIESILLQKFKVYKDIIDINDCHIMEINSEQVESFLNINNLNGYIKTDINIVLKYNNKIVSCISLNKNNNHYELLRYCNKSNIKISNNFKTLLEYFKNKYNPNSISTLCDLRYWNGISLNQYSFNFIENTKPNLFYTWGKNRYNIKLNENINYNIIYDCGNSLYHWTKD